MQSLDDLRLRGLIAPSVSRRVRPMSVAEARRIAGATPTPAARTAVKAPVVRTAKPKTETRDGVSWISESRANGGNLPPGRYQYRDSSGRVHYRDVGEMACRQSLLDRRLHRGDKTGGLSDREIRDGVTVRGAGRFRLVTS